MKKLVLVVLVILTLALTACEVPGIGSTNPTATSTKAVSTPQYRVTSTPRATKTPTSAPAQAPTSAPASAPTTVPAAVQTDPVLAALDALGYNSRDEFYIDAGLAAGTIDGHNIDKLELATVPGEKDAVRILREKDANDQITPFYLGKNPTGCWQDGWRVSPGEVRPGNYTMPENSGIPAKWKGGYVEGFTFRPCP